MSELTALCERLDRLLATLEKPEKAPGLGDPPIFDTFLISATHPWVVDYRNRRYLYLYSQNALTLSMDGGEFTINLPANDWVQFQFNPGIRFVATNQATPVPVFVQFTNDTVSSISLSAVVATHVITDAGSVTTEANSAAILLDTADIETNTGNIPPLGQALAAASVPVVLTAAQLTTLTPPAAITGFALESGGNLDAIETDIDILVANSPALGQALAAASVPVVLTAAQLTTLTPPAAITGFALETGGNLATLVPGVQGWIAATGTGTVTTDDSLTFANQVRRVVLYNASANPVPFEFDQTSTAASIPIQPGQYMVFDDILCTVVHVFPSATLPINTTAGLYVKGWK
jgi:hypothetical protein